jgi:DNA repair ATPase RecN
MIRRLRISNIGNIESADIVLAPFTVFVGPSRAGKSTILRAIRALFTNQTGNRLIKRGATQASVEIETGDGHVIRWEKTRNTSKYVLDGVEYTKLAGSVPPDVEKAVGIRPVPVDASLTLWPQYNAQGEYSFLLPDVGWTSGQLARACARLTRLDVVLEAQKLARSKLRETRERRQRVQNELERLKEKSKRFEEARSVIERALSLRADELLDRAERAVEARALLPRTKPVLVVLPSTDDLSSRLSALEQVLVLSDLVREQKRIERSIGELEKERTDILDRLSRVSVCPVCKRPWHGAHSRPQ